MKPIERTLPMLTAAFALFGVCRTSESATVPQDPGEAQIVALVVRTDPPGAKVRVNRLARTWTTPCDVADFSLRRGTIDVEISLDGYETVRQSVRYEGQDPAILDLKLAPRGAPAAARQDAPKPAEPAPKKAEAPAPPPQAAEGTRLRVQAREGTIRITTAKVQTAEGGKPTEVILPDPSQKVLVEFVDPKTGAVLQSVELIPGTPAALPVPADGDRVGKVQLVHRLYGVFVKLDPGLSLQPGEEIVVVRDGREVARTKILKVCSGDETYPDGALQIPKEGASIKKGDEVRRPKP